MTNDNNGRLSFEATIDDKDFKKKIDSMNKGVEGVAKESEKASKIIEQNTKTQSTLFSKLNTAISGVGKTIGAVFSNFGLIAGIGAFVSLLNGAVRDVVAFDKSMTNLSAIAGQSRSSLKGLESDIRKIASESINTATAVADMAMELIKLGTTPDGVRQLLKPVNDLSIAFQSSADATAVLLKGTLNAFQASESEAQRYADVMAMSANKTALGFQEIADSFSYISATASVAGYSIEETASFMGVLVDNNVQASSAGRVLSSVFGRLAKGGKELEGELEKIRNSQDKLGQASKIFGAEGARLGVILANNKDRLAELNEEFKNSAGSLAKLTNQQLESVSAKWNIAVSAVQELFLTIDSGNGIISRFFKGFLDGIALVATKLSELGKTEVTGLVNSQIDLNRRITEILNVTAQTTEGAKQRLSLIRELKQEYPEFLRGIDAETVSNKTLLDSLQEINEEYRQRIILQGETENANKLKKSYEEAIKYQDKSKKNLIEMLTLFNQKYDLKVDIDFSNIEKSTQQMIKSLSDKGVVKIPFFSDFGQLTSELQQFKSNTANVNLLEQAYRGQKGAVDELRKSISLLTVEEKEAMKAGQEYYKTLDVYGNSIKTNNNDTSRSLGEVNNKTKERLALLDKIEKAERSINESVLNERESAIQKTLEKYRELNKEAVKLGMNTQRIQELQSKELSVVTYKGETDRLKDSLAEQRKMYDEFEAYKFKVGEEQAKKMYANLIDVNKNYYDVISDELDKIDVNTMEAKERNRYGVLTKMLVEYSDYQNKVERDNYEKLYQETQSYEQRITALREEYAKKRADATKMFEGDDLTSRLGEIEKSYTAKANELIEGFASEKGFGTSITNGVIGATKQIILAQINSLRGYLKNAKDLTKTQIDEIEKKIKDLDSKLYQTSDSGGASKITIFNNQLKSLKTELKRLEDSKTFYESLGLQEAGVKIAEIESNIAGVNAQINGLSSQKYEAIADEFGEISNHIDNMSNNLSNADNRTKKMFDNMSKVAKLAQNISKSYESISKNNQDIADGNSSFSGNMSAAMGVMSVYMSIANILQGAENNRLKFLKEERKQRDTYFLGELNWNREMIKLEIEQNRRQLVGSENRRKVIEGNLKLLKEYQEGYDAIYDRLNDPNLILTADNQAIKNTQQEYFENLKEWEKKYNEMTESQKESNEGKRAKTLIESYKGMIFFGKTWQEVDKMIKQGLVAGSNLALANAFVEAGKKAKELGFDIEDLENSFRELVTGTSVDELSDRLADAFRNGEDAVYSFGNTMEEVLKNAVVSAFKNKYIVEEMDKLFKVFGDMGTKGSFTQAEIDEIRKLSKEAAERLQQQWDAINGALDLDFGTSVESSMRDSVKRITEQQADRLVGITMGIQTMMAQNQGVNKNALETLITSQNLLNSSYQTLISIEANTRRSADGIDSINGKLDTIISNNDNSYTKSLGL